MADTEKKLTGDQIEMINNIERGSRTIGGILQLEDAVEASFSNIEIGAMPGFRLAFDGGNTEIVKKSGRVTPSI